MRADHRFSDSIVSPLLPRQPCRLSFECSVGGGSSRPIWRAQQPWSAAEMRPGPKTRTSPENSPYPLAARIFRVSNASPQGNSIQWPKNTGLRKQNTSNYNYNIFLGAVEIQALAVSTVLPASRCSSPTNSVGVILRQRQAHTPINAARNTSPTETSGNRNWHFHRSVDTNIQNIMKKQMTKHPVAHCGWLRQILYYITSLSEQQSFIYKIWMILT